MSSWESPGSMVGTLSVNEICNFEVLGDTRVLAGSHGMKRRVQRLNVMTVPDIVRWTKPHELLLATGFPLPSDTDEMIRLINELDDRRVAALAIKSGEYGAPLDHAVLQTANQRALPVIAVPQEVAFDDVLSEVLAAITNRQAAALQRAQDVHQALLHISLGGGGLHHIVYKLSSVLNGLGVAYVTSTGGILAQSMTDAQWNELRRAGAIDANGAPGPLDQFLSDSRTTEPTLLAAQVPAGEFRHGHLLAVSTDQPLDQEVSMMVQQAAMVAALNISKDLAVDAVARRFESSAIHSILMGTASEIQEVVKRSAAFGWKIVPPLVVLAARREEFCTPSDDAMKSERDLGNWRSAVRNADRTAAVGLLGHNLIAICAAPDKPEHLATTITQALTGTTRQRFLIGLSRTVNDVASLPHAYRHARMALEFTQQFSGSHGFTSYESLGLLRLLNSVSDRSELKMFVEETLGPILDLSMEHRDDMLHTLDILLRSRLNVAEASRILHYHYNTLRYRIRKLEQMLGDFSTNNDLELRLRVALQINKMWTMTG